MLLALDGFDHYTNADAQSKGWSQPFPIAMSSGRFGGGSSANWNPDLTSLMNAYPFKQTSNNHVFKGFAWMFQSVDVEVPVMHFLDGSSIQTTLMWSGALGKFRALAGGLSGISLGSSGVLEVNPNGWHHLAIEVLLHATAGTYEVKLDGVAVLTLTGVKTQTSGVNQATHVALSAALGASGNVWMRYDDMYVLDTSGSFNNAALGDCRVRTTYPVSDGAHSDFTPSSAGTHFDDVNNVVDNATSFVSSQTVGAKDSYHMTSLPATSVVKGVQVVVSGLKTDAAARSLAPLTRDSGGTDHTGTGVGLSGTKQFIKQIQEADPGTSAAWTVANLNNTQFGPQITA